MSDSMSESEGDEPIGLQPMEEEESNEDAAPRFFAKQDPEQLRKRLLRELKILRVHHPDLKIGLTTSLDEELGALTLEELETLRDNYHLELSRTRPFAMGYTLLGLLGKFMETIIKVPGFAQRILADTELVANADQAIPWATGEAQPLFRTALSLANHTAIALSESLHPWTPPTVRPTGMQPPSSSTPPASSSQGVRKRARPRSSST